MRQEWQANRCQLTHGDRRLPRKRVMHRVWRAPSRCSRWSPSVCFPNPVGSQASQQTEAWFINMTVPAQKTLMVASLDRAEYALLDSGSGLTSCPINYADDLPKLPRPVNLPILSYATGDSIKKSTNQQSVNIIFGHTEYLCTLRSCPSLLHVVRVPHLAMVKNNWDFHGHSSLRHSNPC